MSDEGSVTVKVGLDTANLTEGLAILEAVANAPMYVPLGEWLEFQRRARALISETNATYRESLPDLEIDTRTIRRDHTKGFKTGRRRRNAAS